MPGVWGSCWETGDLASFSLDSNAFCIAGWPIRGKLTYKGKWSRSRGAIVYTFLTQPAFRIWADGAEIDIEQGRDLAT